MITPQQPPLETWWELEEFSFVAWTSMICGYARNGQSDEAISLFYLGQSEGKIIMDEVQCLVFVELLGIMIWEKGIKPDEVTFVLIISAYMQTNLNTVNDCRRLFNSLKTVYHTQPTSEHYSSFISVLGHLGLLEEAVETIDKMPFEPTALVWRALLDSCILHKNTMIGK
ncbi:Tetratricopeptide-like helical domain superfamily [Sesbania bispinosa]|nr:Tetratricopeptide-like helical domain superfamily [Sesbania bispinosa]